MRGIWKSNTKLIIVTIFLLIAYVASDIILAFLFGRIIDSASSGSAFQYANVTYLTLGMIIFSAITFYLYYVHKEKTIQGMVMDIKDQVFENTINQSLTEFFKTDLGDKISSLTNDIKIIEEDYFNMYFNIARSLLLFILSLISIFIINYMMAIFLLVLSSLSLILPNIVSKKLVDKKDTFSVTQGDYTSRATEYLSGFSTIHSFGIAKFIINEFKKRSRIVRDSAIDYNKLSNKIDTVTLVLGSITFMGGFLFGGFLVMRNMLTLGEMIICIQLSNNISNPIYSLINNVTALNSVKKIISRIETIMKNDHHKPQREDNIVDINHFENNIELNSLSFGYNDQNILEDINIKFDKGKKYAIVGASGAGKSTLMNLIRRKIYPNSGSINIDELNFDYLSDFSILKLMSYIEQDVFLFKGSLRDNICMFQDYSEEDVQNALIESGLEKFLSNSKDSIQISENGNSLSGGERQRVAIARAIIRRTPILLADEILSNLDNQIANDIEKALLSLEDTTVIAITHKFITDNLKKYDEIILLKDGKIRGKGTFEELFEESDDFKNLYAITAQ